MILQDTGMPFNFLMVKLNDGFEMQIKRFDSFPNASILFAIVGLHGKATGYFD